MGISRRPSVTEDEFWKLPPEGRADRERRFRDAPLEAPAAGHTAYEALQPPLYYWLMTPAMVFHTLPAQVLAVRWMSIAMASLIIPMIFAIGRTVLEDERLGLCSAAAVAVMPGLAIDVARAGNDCLAVLLFTVLIWVGLKERGRRGELLLGIALGLGLLTKAYFLTAIPAIVLVKRRRAVMPVLVAVAISGWWYGRNVVTTGTLAGLSESVMLRGVSSWTLLRRAFTIPWGTAIDSILFSHLYFGGWSGLTVRSWMYHLFYLVILVAAVGLWRTARKPAVVWLLAIYGAFWAAQIYNVVLLFVSKGLAGSMGWYLYGVIAAEAVLCTAGLSRVHRLLPAAGVLLLALLDLYTVHWLAIPYYTGAIQHKANGALAAYHFEAIHFERLTVFKDIPAPFLAVLWVLYLGATVWLAVQSLTAVMVSGRPRR